MNHKKTSLIKYISGLLLFGLNGVIADKILLPSYEIVFLRTLIGSLFLIAVFYLGGHRLSLVKDNKKEVLFVLLSGISMGASWIVLYEAYQRIGVGMSSISSLPVQSVSILGYLEPLSSVIFALLLLHEPMSLLQLTGAFLILAGSVLSEISGSTAASTS